MTTETVSQKPATYLLIQDNYGSPKVVSEHPNFEDAVKAAELFLTVDRRSSITIAKTMAVMSVAVTPTVAEGVVV